MAHADNAQFLGRGWAFPPSFDRYQHQAQMVSAETLAALQAAHQAEDEARAAERPREAAAEALDKARAEMSRGRWLASLEFEAAGWQPQAVLRCPDGRPLWLYRLPLRASSSAAEGR